jgi:hypothetical protein
MEEGAMLTFDLAICDLAIAFTRAIFSHMTGLKTVVAQTLRSYEVESLND